MDTATKSLKHILESPEYERIEGVPIFDEHDEFDGRKYIKDASGKQVINPNFGKLLRKFDKKRLEEIVAVCNKRARETGDLSPIGPGHLIPNGREEFQPPIWGYAAGEYRVGTFGPNSKLGILATLYMKKRVDLPDGRSITGRQTLQEFPRRSVELWHKDSMIDWIALLRQTPERDLGLTAVPYCKERFAPWGMDSEVFFDIGKSRYARSADDGQKLRYSMDGLEGDGDDNTKVDEPDRNQNNNPNKKPDDPTKPPDSEITPADQPLSPTEEQQAERFMCHYMKKYPWMGDAETKYSAMMSGTNTGMPSPVTSQEPDMEDTEKAAYQKQIDDQKAQIDTLNSQVQTLIEANKRQDRVSKYSKDLSTLSDEGYVINMTDELAEFGDLPDDKWAKHVQRIKDCYKKNEVPPTGRDILFLDTKSPRDPKQQIDQEETDKVLAYMRRNNISSFDDAVTQYRKAN